MIADTDIGNDDNVTAYRAKRCATIYGSGDKCMYEEVTDDQPTIHNVKAPRRQPFTLGASGMYVQLMTVLLQ